MWAPKAVASSMDGAGIVHDKGKKPVNASRYSGAAYWNRPRFERLMARRPLETGLPSRKAFRAL